MAKKILSQKLNKGNVNQMDPKRRKAYDLNKWKSELTIYLFSLSADERKIAKRLMDIIVKKPGKQEKHESSEVIQFPVNRLGKI